ncbi:MAG: flavodoxin family protein [Clostridiales bacterium]|nr:flavodoxin family protein [Clostridiales bacterium]
MKVLMINGSPKAEGCTATGLMEIGKVLEQEGISWELYTIPTTPVRDCIGCNGCRRNGGQGCVFGDDCVNELITKARACDGFVFGTPVYYAHPSGRILSVLDRCFYAGGDAFAHKPAAAVASARRAGTVTSFDVLNKYFTIKQMPIVSSTYWNEVHGNRPEEVLQDEEGLQTMRNIGRNMAWLLKCIALGRENGIPAPETEQTFHTNFVR